MSSYSTIARETLLRSDCNSENKTKAGSSPRSPHAKKLESELRASKLSLFDDIEKRKSTEEVLSQWQKLGDLASQSGITFPPPPDATSVHLDDDSIEQLSQVLVITHLFAEAMGKAEAELDAEAIIQSKDQEISRLRDKLQYYGADHKTLTLEVPDWQRARKKSQRRWLWSCIGLSMVIGSSVIAYSFLLRTEKPQPSANLNDSSDAS